MKFTTEHLSQQNINAINAVIRAYQHHSKDWTPQKYVTWCLISKTNEILEKVEERKKAEESTETFMHDSSEDASAFSEA